MFTASFSVRLALLSVFLGALLAITLSTLAQGPNRGQVGEWGPVIQNFPLSAGYANLLHTGKVLYTSSHLYTPPADATGTGSWVSITGPQDHGFHCSGYSQLPDGRILFTGGDEQYLTRTTLYDPDDGATGAWNELGPISPANRWYPTCTTLPDGTILAMAGHHNDLTANTPAIFDPVTSQ